MDACLKVATRATSTWLVAALIGTALTGCLQAKPGKPFEFTIRCPQIGDAAEFAVRSVVLGPFAITSTTLATPSSSSTKASQSSGTSGCAKPESAESRAMARVRYIDAMGDTIPHALAQGGGERVEVLAALFGCDGPASEHLAREFQRALPTLLSETPLSARERHLQMEGLVRADPDLSTGCGFVALHP
ncbi:MAG TPA: DUF3015 family protein [bacterium]